MRTWITLVSCAAVVAVTLSCAFPAIGQDYRTANAPMPTDRITQLENELAALKGTIQRASWSDGQYAGDGCCETDCRETGCGDACGSGCDCGCGGGCGIYAGFEFIFMRPYLRAQPEIGLAVLDIEAVAGLSFDHDFEITPRLWMGFVGQCGLGVRARYWQYDHAANGSLDFSLEIEGEQMWEEEIAEVLDAIGICHDLEMHVFDIEATQDFNWCRAGITVGAGVRYARLQQNLSIGVDQILIEEPSALNGDPFLFANLGSGFEGAGPTVSVDFRRRIGQSRFSVVGGLRESVLFVTTTKDLSVGGSLINGFNGENTALDDNEFLRLNARNEEVRAITELRVGLEYERCMRCCTLLVHGGYEGQIWHSTGQALLNTADLGMHGISAGFTVAR